MNSSSQLRQNITQQTKRLLSQLQQLQTLREQLSEQQYIQLRQSTLQQLQIFQHSLSNLIKDPSNSLLQSQLQKTKRLIFEAIKTNFNKDQIKSKILQEQVKGIRYQIKQLDKAFELKKIQPKQYHKKRRNFVVQLEQAGVELTKEESQCVEMNFTQKAQEQYANQQNIEMKKVQQNIIKDF